MCVLMKKAKILLLPLFVAVLNIMILLHPAESLAAARSGISVWALNVVPGVLSFAILGNVLIALGAAHFLGALFEPVMRRVFSVSGGGALPFVIGLIAGYPIGAKVVSSMREAGEIDKTDAQRLLAVCSNAGPLFVVGAVGAGMFGSGSAGYFLLAAHYAGAFGVSLIMRLYGKSKGQQKNNMSGFAGRPRGYIAAYRAMAAARRRDGRGFGAVLGGAVMDAANTMLLVGGFIVLFSVVSALISATPLFGALGFETDGIFAGVFAGTIEMAGGVSKISVLGINAVTLAAAVFIISFGGVSVLCQCVNFISKTDVSSMVFVLCKIVHGFISAGIVLAAYPLFSRFFDVAPVFGAYETSVLGAAGLGRQVLLGFGMFAFVVVSVSVLMVVLGVLGVLGVLIRKKKSKV